MNGTNKNYYLLNKNIALRSWQKLPFAYRYKNIGEAFALSKDNFLLLLKCDGRQLLEESNALNTLIEMGYCSISDGSEELSDWQRLKLYPNRYFPAMNLEITGKCNYNCLHCFNAADLAPLQSELTWDECEHLLDEAQGCGIAEFTITGGEPMLHPHFMDILHGIYKRDMLVEELNTNGSFITDEMLLEMKSFGCNPTMKISFDGIGRHDIMRGRKGAEQAAINAIRLCIKHGFTVMAQTNVNRLNLSSMLPTLELLDELGVSSVRLIRTSESPRWLQTSAKLCEGGGCLSFREHYDAMLALAHSYIQKEHKMSLNIWQFMRVFPMSKTYSDGASCCAYTPYSDTLPVCRINRRMIGVSAAGELVPCLQMSGYYSQKGISLGNVKKTSLSKLLSDGAYIDEICRCVPEIKEHNTSCMDCEFWTACRGGCRALGLALTDDRKGADKSKCIYYHEGYPEKIAKLFADCGYCQANRCTGGGSVCLRST